MCVCGGGGGGVRLGGGNFCNDGHVTYQIECLEEYNN